MAFELTLSPRRGSEELTQRRNAMYDALIGTIAKYGGSMVGFSGDGFAVRATDVNKHVILRRKLRMLHLLA